MPFIPSENVNMLLPSPSELCWGIKLPPEQKWLEKAIHFAVSNIWLRAHRIARSQLGDESQTLEMIEIAIGKAVDRLQLNSQASPEEVTQLLERLYLQEVRHRRKANNRIVLVGASEDLPSTSTHHPQSLVDSAIDLDIILQNILPEVRFALLLRYSQSRWNEIAAVLGTTEASIRLRCKRALNRIRQKLEDKKHGL
jgi:DNA-directed RNA polymerase specialized sigma24 family protein